MGRTSKRGNVDVLGGWNPIKWITSAQINPKLDFVVPKDQRRSYYSPRRRAEGKDIPFTRETYERIPVIGKVASNVLYGEKKYEPKEKNVENKPNLYGTVIGPDGERVQYYNRGGRSQYGQSAQGYRKKYKSNYAGAKTGYRYSSKGKRVYTRNYYGAANRGGVQWMQKNRYKSRKRY